MQAQNLVNYQFSSAGFKGNNKEKSNRKEPKRRTFINYIDMVYKPKKNEKNEDDNALGI